MAISQPPNMLQYAAKQLEKEIHNKVADKIVNSMIEDFHKRIRPIVEEKVNEVAISIETNESWSNMAHELKIYCEFK